jgi:hypothetical protein
MPALLRASKTYSLLSVNHLGNPYNQLPFSLRDRSIFSAVMVRSHFLTITAL